MRLCRNEDRNIWRKIRDGNGKERGDETVLRIVNG